jgi:hypothetical protein
VADARNHQRHLLCHAGGLPVALAAERLAATGDKFTAGLNKDAPISRPSHQTGIIRSQPILGGLHHHYVRV